MKSTNVMAAGALAGALALLPVAGAQAQEREGWYFGVSGGASSIDVSRADFDAFADNALVLGSIDLMLEDPSILVDFQRTGESSLDDSGTGWSAYAGYRWRYVAAEVGYLNLGRASYRTPIIVNPIDPAGPAFEASATGKAASQGAFAALLGVLPLGSQFDLYVRGGVYNSRTTVSLEGFASAKATSNDLFAGIGADWSFSEGFAARVEYTRYLDVGDEDRTGEFDIDLVSVSVLFR